MATSEDLTVVEAPTNPTVQVRSTIPIRHYISTDRILDEALPRFTRRAYLQIAARIVSLFIGITGVVMSVMMIIVDPLNSAAGGIAVAAVRVMRCHEQPLHANFLSAEWNVLHH